MGLQQILLIRIRDDLQVIAIKGVPHTLQIPELESHQSGGAVEYANCFSLEEYSFIAIALRSTLTRSGST